MFFQVTWSLLKLTNLGFKFQKKNDNFGGFSNPGGYENVMKDWEKFRAEKFSARLQDQLVAVPGTKMLTNQKTNMEIPILLLAKKF